MGASSYIKTEASAVTRAEDNVSRVLGDEFNPYSFTLYFEGQLTSGVDLNACVSLGNSDSNITRFLSITRRSSGSIQALLNFSDSLRTLTLGSVGVNENFKAATSYDNTTGVLKSSLNGGAIVSLDVGQLDATALSAIDALLIGKYRRAAAATNPQISKDTRYYPAALTDVELQEITKL